MAVSFGRAQLTGRSLCCSCAQIELSEAAGLNSATFESSLRKHFWNSTCYFSRVFNAGGVGQNKKIFKNI